MNQDQEELWREVSKASRTALVETTKAVFLTILPSTSDQELREVLLQATDKVGVLPVREMLRVFA